MSDYIGVVTNAGQAKIAAAIGGAALNLTTIRFGDGNGAPIVPTPVMTDLVRRVGGAYAITASGRDPVNANHWRFTTIIPAGDGPFDIREIGIFDAAGDMIAVARHVLVEKRTPAQGAAVELETDIVFPVSETAQVTVQVNPDASVSIGRLMQKPWLPVVSMTIANPPAVPVLGDTYVIPAAATGAWAGLTGSLAHWNGYYWEIFTTPNGHGVCLPDGRVFVRLAAAYAELAASETLRGLVKLATQAEVMDATGVNVVSAQWMTGYARRLTADLALYVRADGSDANDGLLNTAGRAFRTVQAAVNSIARRFVAAGRKITINIGAGNGFGPVDLSSTSGMRIEITGSGSSTELDGGAGVNVVAAEGSTRLKLTAVKLIGGSIQLYAASGAFVEYGNITFTKSTGYTMQAFAGGLLKQISACSLIGDGTATAVSCFTASTGGVIDLNGASFTFSGTPIFSTGTAWASAGTITASGFTATGAVTGQRYLSAISATIYTAGAGANVFPGTVAGVIAQNGYYY